MTAFTDLWYRSSDGLQLYARDYPGPAHDAPVLLCMHGLTRNSADFAGIAPRLAQHFRVLVADQRGRGRSDYDPDPTRYQPMTYVQDMFGLLDHEGVQKALLLGTSMGGLMAMLMAAMQPERFSALILNDIGPQVDPVGLARIKAYVGKAEPVADWAGAMAQARAINGDAFPTFSDDEWRRFAGALYRQRAEGEGLELAYDPAISAPLAAAEDTAVPPDLWPVFTAIAELPILVLRGVHSDILSPEGLEAMQASKPDLAIAVIADRGHAPTLDEPDARAAIEEFLSQFS